MKVGIIFIKYRVTLMAAVVIVGKSIMAFQKHNDGDLLRFLSSFAPIWIVSILVLFFLEKSLTKSTKYLGN